MHCQKIRGDLIADREKQPSYVKRAHNEAFGIYRPLTEKSAMHIRDVLTGAKEEIEDFLQKRRTVSAEIIIPNDLGATFLMKNKVRRAMRFGGLLQRGFELGRMLQSVEDHNPSQEVSLEVPIDNLQWYTRHGRKLVCHFADSDAADELATETSIVEELLDGANANGQLKVRQPDHVAVYAYGNRNDRLDLSRCHKAEVAAIVQEHFDAAQIGSVTLGGLVVGDSYSQPRRFV